MSFKIDLSGTSRWVSLGLGILLCLSGAQSLAEEIPKSQTLDFEGEVIEGESMRPDLFLQIMSPEVNLDSIIYMRKDFNDFHRVDRKQRPQYLPERN